MPPPVQEGTPPTVDALLNIARVGWSTAISPDGRFVAYVINKPDFHRDVYLNDIFIAERATGKTFQLTKGEDNFYELQWSPNGKWLCYVSGRLNQVLCLPASGGESVQLTKAENGVGHFSWSPDGKYMAYTSDDEEPAHIKIRKADEGDFTVVGERERNNCLWVLEIDRGLKEPTAGSKVSQGYSISGLMTPFSWSPDASKIAFSAIGVGNAAELSSDIYSFTLSDKSIKQIVSQPGRDRDPQWAPDGNQIIFTSDMGDKGLQAYTFDLAVVDAVGGIPVSITDRFDDNPRLVCWNKQGIYFWAWRKKGARLFRLDPISHESTRVSTNEELSCGGFSITGDGRHMAFTASSPSTIEEVYAFDITESSTTRLTSLTEQVSNYDLGVREVIQWRNKTDGLEMTGVLTKPKHFSTSGKYPLMLVVHGGPSEVRYPALLNWRYYPVDVWTSRGAVVLEVNYRGSAGHGSLFNDLAYRGFLKQRDDIMSGVDYLVQKGWIDTTRIVCMGWSHGGYLTSLLATTSNRFKAVSVGAGAFDWSTFYYHSTTGAELAKSYLGANPLDDPEIYRLVSPSSYVRDQSTPALIQHGESDAVVPLSESIRYRRTLDDLGVKAQMIIYRRAGHGISRPKSLRAATKHNLYWFNHFVWGDPLPDFSKPVSSQVKDTGKL